MLRNATSRYTCLLSHCDSEPVGTVSPPGSDQVRSKAQERSGHPLGHPKARIASFVLDSVCSFPSIHPNSFRCLLFGKGKSSAEESAVPAKARYHTIHSRPQPLTSTRLTSPSLRADRVSCFTALMPREKLDKIVWQKGTSDEVAHSMSQVRDMQSSGQTVTAPAPSARHDCDAPPSTPITLGLGAASLRSAVCIYHTYTNQPLFPPHRLSDGLDR